MKTLNFVLKVIISTLVLLGIIGVLGWTGACETDGITMAQYINKMYVAIIHILAAFGINRFRVFMIN